MFSGAGNHGAWEDKIEKIILINFLMLKEEEEEEREVRYLYLWGICDSLREWVEKCHLQWVG